MSMLHKKAPAFELPDADGKPVSLSSLLESGPAVVYFYPRNNTSGCTKEACSFRDAFAAFVEAGCKVVGISADDAGSHRKFTDKHKLPFPLLTDHGGTTAKAWGVSKTLGLIPGRETFLVAQDGTIVHEVSGLFSVNRHVEDTLAALQKLRG